MYFANNIFALHPVLPVSDPSYNPRLDRCVQWIKSIGPVNAKLLKRLEVRGKTSTTNGLSRDVYHFIRRVERIIGNRKRMERMLRVLTSIRQVGGEWVETGTLDVLQTYQVKMLLDRYAKSHDEISS